MWFGNFPTSTELKGFHYYQGKYKVQLQCFNLTKDNNEKTLITKTGFLHSTHRIHNGLQNKPKNFPIKSPVKNHATLFGSSQVVNWIKHKLGSTKPNIEFKILY